MIDVPYADHGDCRTAPGVFIALLYYQLLILVAGNAFDWLRLMAHFANQITKPTLGHGRLPHHKAADFLAGRPHLAYLEYSMCDAQCLQLLFVPARSRDVLQCPTRWRMR